MYYCNYRAIQLRVLKGSFSIEEKKTQDAMHKFKLPQSVLFVPHIKKELCIYKKIYTHTFSPVVKVQITAKQPSAMLQLHYYNQFYD